MKLLDDRAVRWLLVPAVVFISQTISDAYLLDAWHHLARGREIVTSGRLLDHDVFTYTVADRPFQDVNWGSQVIYYSLFQVGGLGLVRVMNALVLAAAWGWLIAIGRRESGSLEAAGDDRRAARVSRLVPGAGPPIRPQTFSILLFVAMLDVLLRAERDRRWLWGTLPIMAAWANLHGAFPAGLILVGCSWMAACVSAIFAFSAPLSPGVRRLRSAGEQEGRRGLGVRGRGAIRERVGFILRQETQPRSRRFFAASGRIRRGSRGEASAVVRSNHRRMDGGPHRLAAGDARQSVRLGHLSLRRKHVRNLRSPADRRVVAAELRSVGGDRVHRVVSDRGLAGVLPLRRGTAKRTSADAP